MSLFSGGFNGGGQSLLSSAAPAAPAGPNVEGKALGGTDAFSSQLQSFKQSSLQHQKVDQILGSLEKSLGRQMTSFESFAQKIGQVDRDLIDGIKKVSTLMAANEALTQRQQIIHSSIQQVLDQQESLLRLLDSADAHLTAEEPNVAASTGAREVNANLNRATTMLYAILLA
eukprot:Filipodium_phascolosomae@DN776_c0_g1_i1.p1